MSCPGASEPMFGMERPTQGEARRPTKSDKARHVGPPSATRRGTSAHQARSTRRGRETYSRRGPSAHQERQGEARRPTLSVCSSLPTFGIERPTQGEARRPTRSDKARHVGPPSAVYSPSPTIGKGGDLLKARHVGPPRAATMWHGRSNLAKFSSARSLHSSLTIILIHMNGSTGKHVHKDLQDTPRLHVSLIEKYQPEICRDQRMDRGPVVAQHCKQRLL